MKLEHDHAASSVAFDGGRLSLTVESPGSAIRLHEYRTSAFVLSREQGADLVESLRNWLEGAEPSRAWRAGVAGVREAATPAEEPIP